jgi:hypothetical protein
MYTQKRQNTEFDFTRDKKSNFFLSSTVNHLVSGKKKKAPFGPSCARGGRIISARAQLRSKVAFFFI